MRRRRVTQDEWVHLWREHQWGCAGFALWYLILLSVTLGAFDGAGLVARLAGIALSLAVLFALPFGLWIRWVLRPHRARRASAAAQVSVGGQG